MGTRVELHQKRSSQIKFTIYTQSILGDSANTLESKEWKRSWNKMIMVHRRKLIHRVLVRLVETGISRRNFQSRFETRRVILFEDTENCFSYYKLPREKELCTEELVQMVLECFSISSNEFQCILTNSNELQWVTMLFQRVLDEDDSNGSGDLACQGELLLDDYLRIMLMGEEMWESKNNRYCWWYWRRYWRWCWWWY